jgi:hypothetical protein
MIEKMGELLFMIGMLLMALSDRIEEFLEARPWRGLR